MAPIVWSGWNCNMETSRQQFLDFLDRAHFCRGQNRLATFFMDLIPYSFAYLVVQHWQEPPKCGQNGSGISKEWITVDIA